MSNNRPKIRKRKFASDVYDNFDQNFDEERLDPSQVVSVKFQNNELDIVVDKRVNYELVPGRCELNEESTSLLMSKDYWHSITVHHQGSFGKEEISNGIDNIVNNNLFSPVAYRSGKYEDDFFIYNQPAALQQMLSRNLVIIVGNRRLTFTLKLAVANYIKGHLNPIEKLDMGIADVINKFREFRLDFCYFGQKNRFLPDVQFSFKNRACFEIFCDHLYNMLHHEANRDVRESLKILVLVGNNIKYLEPLSKLSVCPQLHNISLKNNAIDSISELDALKSFNSLTYLSVAGNPLVKYKEVELSHQIMEIFPYLEKLDIKRKPLELSTTPVQPVQEKIIIPTTKCQSEVVKSSDVDEKFKIEFPRKEYVKTFWSRVIIEHNGRFNGREVLDEMFRIFFVDMPCYPCYYKTGALEDSFMLHMNFAPMNTLVQNDLKMRMPDSDEYVTFRLHLKCGTFMNGEVKWGDVITKVVSKRLTPRKLDLSNFRNDPEFRDVVVNFESTHLKGFVLTCASNVNSSKTIIDINLSNNGIRSFKGLELLKNFPELISLDLSNNKIESLTGFPDNMKLIELSLTFNPLCNYFKNKTTTTYDYVKILTTFCPQLEFLDGRKIDRNYKLVHNQNYYPASVAYPAIEYFVDFFFKNFDSLQARSSILCNVFYRADSIVSIKHGTDETITKCGCDDIKNLYASFPYTEHDYVTMTVDTPLFSKNIIIVINGILKQNDYDAMNPEDKLFTFSRTFMLRKDRRNCRTPGTLSNTFDYVIQNEIFHYESLTDFRIKNKAFKKRRATKNEIERVHDDLYKAEIEFAANLELLKQTTCLQDVWCRRFLEDANGDYEVALTYFIDFYKCGMFKQEDFVF